MKRPLGRAAAHLKASIPHQLPVFLLLIAAGAIRRRGAAGRHTGPKAHQRPSYGLCQNHPCEGSQLSLKRLSRGSTCRSSAGRGPCHPAPGSAGRQHRPLPTGLRARLPGSPTSRRLCAATTSGVGPPSQKSLSESSLCNPGPSGSLTSGLRPPGGRPPAPRPAVPPGQPPGARPAGGHPRSESRQVEPPKSPLRTTAGVVQGCM